MGQGRCAARLLGHTTKDAKFSRALRDARHLDRLNIGAMPTVQLNWFQPHEGSIVGLLFRARAYMTTSADKE